MSEDTKIEPILEVSPAAEAKINELIEGREQPDLAVRVAIRGTLPGGGYQTEFKFMPRDEATSEDLVQVVNGFDLIFEPEVAEVIAGSKVDFDERRYAAGFNIEYPARSPYPPGVEARQDWDDPVAQKVQQVIDDYINPGVAGHGGWVLLKDVKENKAIVQMGGGCQGCGLSAVTLRQGIETAIMEAVPEIEGILDDTDHDEGENPYYAAEAAEGASPLGA
jgi:Fe/S biogenesis protein NfuA